MTREASNKILIGIVIGIVCAFLGLLIFGEKMVSVKFLGDFFLTALQMVVVPLVVASVTVGIIRMGDVRKVGRAGLLTLGYYAVTTAFAVGLGIFLVTTIQPGVGMTTDSSSLISAEDSQSLMGRVEGRQGVTWADLLLSAVHPNLFDAFAKGKMLPVILFSLLFGGIISTMGAKGKPLIDLFESLNEVIMRLVHIIMWLAPIGIFGLVASKFASFGPPEVWVEKLSYLGKYMSTVIIGLLVHGAVTLPLITYFFAKRNPLQLFLAIMPAWLTALSTASSSATLPLTIDCAENRANISPKTAGFVLPLGATINMDGTALYEAVATIFIAQAYGIHLEPQQLILVFMLATVISIGAAGIPEAGLFMMVIILEALDLPFEAIALIFVIDWLLDRFRTSINVWGDCVGAAVIDNLSGTEPTL
ncbi:MAG TPA: dicarboxylate/amino acid:cation symporter [bacterium]|jgi:Na+/H+-dicarboxylate symporter